MITNITIEDLDELKRLHGKFFAGEFTFDDFLLGSLSNFLIRDDTDGEIITAGSIRPISEMVAITNLDKSARVRRAALYDALQIAHYVLKNTPMNQLHVFVQDNKWETQLIRSGFQRTVGNALYINL